MLQRKIILLLFILNLFSSKAQIPQSPSEGLTPNAKSYERYGDIPVSLYTGTPNITIPLDTLESGKLTLPLSLSYHSAGVKAEEHPGWVGLGWTLNSGGAITREVRELPDEYDDPEYGQRGVMYHPSILKDSTFYSDWQKCDKFVNELSSESLSFLLRLDTEPDIFRFNFCNYSGFFILDSEGKWRVYCDSPLKVEIGDLSCIDKLNDIAPPVNRKCINNITLTDENGIKYLFGNESREYSIDIRRQPVSAPFCNTWKLIEITHPNGDYLKFEYEEGNPIASLTFIEQKELFTVSDIYVCNYGNPFGGQLMFPTYLKSIKGNDLYVKFSANNTSELSYSDDDYLDRLYYDGAEGSEGTTFCYLKKSWESETYSEEFAHIKWRKLNTITICDGEGKIFKNINFAYNDNPNERLALENVRIGGVLDYAEDIYQFHYKDLDKLPKYLSNQTDHWGYYNSKPRTLWETGECQQPDPVTATYGLLERIVYPTGGYTKLEFESNTYTSHLDISGCNLIENKETIAGGVRIKNIKNYSCDGALVNNRDFYYVKDYRKNATALQSCGILEGCPTYKLHRDFFDFEGLKYDIYGTASLVPATNPMGDIVTYPEVTEVLSNGSYIIHRFTSLNQESFRNEPLIFNMEGFYVNPPNSKANYRGKPLSTEYYSSDGTLRKRVKVSYIPHNGMKSFVGAWHLSIRRITMPDFVTVATSLRIYMYKTYIYPLMVAESTTETYEEGINIPHVETHKYTYNDKKQIKSDSFEYSFGKSRHTSTTEYHYMWEKDATYEKNMQLSAVASVEKYKDGKAIMSINNTYDFSGTFPVLTKVFQSYGKSKPVIKYQCLKWDKKGNPVFVIWGNKKQTCYLWNADFTYPVAEISNCSLPNMARILGFSPEEAPYHEHDIYNILDIVKKAQPQAFVTTYTYIPHIGVRSITSPSGNRNIYNYDSYGRLQSIYNSQNEIKHLFETSKAVAADPEQNYQDWKYLYHDYLTYSFGIIGPNVIMNGSTVHYTLNSGFIPGDCKWTIEGDTCDVDFLSNDDEVMIRNHHKKNSTASVTLKLSIYDAGGTVLGYKSKRIQLCQNKMDVQLVPYVFSKDSVVITASVTDKEGKIRNDYELYINGEYHKKSPDSAGTDYRRFNILRNRRRKYYHIVIKLDGDVFSKEYTDYELFK